MATTAAGKPGNRQGLWAALRWLGKTALKLTCGLALLLFVAVAVFAVRSYWVQDMAQVAYQWYPTPESYCARWLGVRSLRGTLSFSVVRNDFDLTRPASIVSGGDEPGWVDEFRMRKLEGFRGSYSTIPAARNQMQVSILRPAYKHDDRPSAGRHDEYWTLTVPSPYVLLVLSVLPALYGFRVLRSPSRAQQGLCAHCGYDLRASGEICPECGTSRPPTFTRHPSAE